MEKREEYKSNIESVLKNYDTSILGLSSREAQKRVLSYGKNELPKSKKDSIIKLFLSEFVNPIIIVLLVACVFSFIAGEVIDASAIIFIILLDAVVGTIQEWKANKSAEALESMIKYIIKVKRDNKIIEIDSSDVVIGDIMILESGNKVCADARIIESNNLTVDESTLTGESIASIKNNLIIKKDVNISDRTNMLYAGTSVITGRCEAVVTSTGANTEIGALASKVYNSKETSSPLMIRMDKFTNAISALIVVIAVLLTFLLKSKGVPGSEIFLSVVALSVSAMPEGLPLALTMALTIGSNKMAKKNVIVKKLNSVESLGSCTVIASDKTGTLTVNEQTAKKIVIPSGDTYDITGSGYNDEGVLKLNKNKAEYAYEICKLGVLNNESGLTYEDKTWRHFGDSIDTAFLALGLKINVDVSNIEKYGIIPYESQNKYSAVFFKENGKSYCSIKGSFEKVLSFCNKMKVEGKDVPINMKELKRQSDELSSNGYRVIALACAPMKNLTLKDYYKESEIPALTFIGFVGFIDPIRKEAAAAVKNSLKAGIKVVMITGDHPLTSLSIAKELGLASNINEITSGEEIDKYFNLGISEFDKFVSTIKVFTRVSPIQKLEIVESYKRQGEFIAVTRDGVNDGPALKAANIGVAMGNGSDVAKEISSMIIIDNNFNSIVSAIKEGRIAYSNIRKIIYLLLSCGLAEVLSFVLSIIFDFPMPLVAVQLLWLNIVTDGLQDLALSFEREESNIMNVPPRDPKESVFDKLLRQEIIVSGAFIGILIFAVWVILIKVFKMDTYAARGYVMALMVFIQNFHVLNCKSEKESVFNYSFKKNKMIIVTILLSIILQFIVMEVPVLSGLLQTTSIPLYQVGIIFFISLPVLLVMEIFKYIKRKRTN